MNEWEIKESNSCIVCRCTDSKHANQNQCSIQALWSLHRFMEDNNCISETSQVGMTIIALLLFLVGMTIIPHSIFILAQYWKVVGYIGIGICLGINIGSILISYWQLLALAKNIGSILVFHWQLGIGKILARNIGLILAFIGIISIGLTLAKYIGSILVFYWQLGIGVILARNIVSILVLHWHSSYWNHTGSLYWSNVGLRYWYHIGYQHKAYNWHAVGQILACDLLFA